MIKMDFKGLMWVGNVFQKFEAMCLEVEEVVCEDTVNYVENQVQTVGASMKKFYSEIMQDVLPPSSIDPVKVAAADLSLNPYADFSIHKKPKVSAKKDDVANYKPSSGDLKNEYCSKKGVIKRIPRKENNLISEVSQSFDPASEDLNRVSEFYEMDKKYDVATSRNDAVMGTKKISDCSCVEDLENITSAIVSAADISGAKKEKQTRDTSSQGPSDESSARINGACGTDGVDSMIGSYVSCNQRISESAAEDSSPTGDADMNSFESDEDKAEPSETIQEFDKLNCVVVGREDLSVAAPIETKPRSYKKKIRKAFSSKRSARKQEYKQLAVQHVSLGSGLNQENEEKFTDKEKSPPHRISETEWELL